jgi:hypothetical protein
LDHNVKFKLCPYDLREGGEREREDHHRSLNIMKAKVGREFPFTQALLSHTHIMNIRKTSLKKISILLNDVLLMKLSTKSSIITFLEGS